MRIDPGSVSSLSLDLDFLGLGEAGALLLGDPGILGSLFGEEGADFLALFGELGTTEAWLFLFETLADLRVSLG